MKMSVTRGLRELKLLDARINTAIGQLNVLDIKQEKYKGKALKSNQSIEDFQKQAESTYNSIVDLQKRRTQIKTGIILSNVMTKVSVAGQEMTVAEAIERKNRLPQEKGLLNRLKQQRSEVDRAIITSRAELDNSIANMIASNLGSDSKNKTKEIEDVIVTFTKANELQKIDPLNLDSKIEVLENDINSFESEIDVVLSESNSRTEIEVSE